MSLFLLGHSVVISVEKLGSCCARLMCLGYGHKLHGYVQKDACNEDRARAEGFV